MKKPDSVPPLRLHKGTGQGYVLLNGRRHYLGKYDQASTKAAYDTLIAEWLAAGRRVRVRADDITVSEILAGFWRHVEGYYRKPDGSPGKEVEQIRLALRHLRALYGTKPAAQFGPLALEAVRQHMIGIGNSRTYINRHVSRIKMAFKWAVSKELIPSSVYEALRTVPGLKRGRSDARETEPVRPAPDQHVDAVLGHVSPQVAAIIRLQLLTAARPDELLGMRPVDLDTTGKVWIHAPADHKTAHHGHDRRIYLGPKAQALIKPFLAGRPVDAFVFSPNESEAWRHAQAPTHRRPDQEPNPRTTVRTVGDRYTTSSYRRAIHRACDAAGVPRWSPHRLRHSAGTTIRKAFGLEAAQLLLGHARADVTQLYAEVNQAKAVEVARRIG